MSAQTMSLSLSFVYTSMPFYESQRTRGASIYQQHSYYLPTLLNGECLLMYVASGVTLHPHMLPYSVLLLSHCSNWLKWQLNRHSKETNPRERKYIETRIGWLKEKLKTMDHHILLFNDAMVSFCLVLRC